MSTPKADDPVAARMKLRFEVENFLYREADLMDNWLLDDWLALWTEELLYLVPSTDKPEGNPREHLMFIQDDRFLLNQRVRSIMNGTAWAESPRSTLRRVISNVQVKSDDNGRLTVTSNFVVYRSQGSTLQVFPAHAEYLLERSGEANFLIRQKRVVLDLEELRPHGRVAFIL